MSRRFQLILSLCPMLLFALPAAAIEYAWQPGQQLVGEESEYVTKAGDNLNYVPRDMDLGFTQLMAANRGVDPWHVAEGTTLKIATAYILPDVPLVGIVVNLAQQRLYYFPPDGGRVITHPISVGVFGHSLPVGATEIIEKKEQPTWYPPRRLQISRGVRAVVPPGPHNPLGEYALRLGWYSYMIHGTLNPPGIGRMVSQGCMRMYPEDIKSLFYQVDIGTPVRIVSDNVVAAWVGNELFVQVFPNKSQTTQLSSKIANFDEQIPAELNGKVQMLAMQRNAQVNWNAVREAGLRRTGLVVQVATSTGMPPVAASPVQTEVEYSQAVTTVTESR